MIILGELNIRVLFDGRQPLLLKTHLLYLAVVLHDVICHGVRSEKDTEAVEPIILVSIFLLLLGPYPSYRQGTAGARRWFKVGPINFQPSEFAKIAIIIYMADLVSRKGILMKSFIHSYLPAVIMLGAVVGLVLLEPDLRTPAITASLIAFIILYVGTVLTRFIYGIIPGELARPLLSSLQGRL